MIDIHKLICSATTEFQIEQSDIDNQMDLTGWTQEQIAELVKVVICRLYNILQKIRYGLGQPGHASVEPLSLFFPFSISLNK